MPLSPALKKEKEKSLKMLPQNNSVSPASSLAKVCDLELESPRFKSPQHRKAGKERKALRLFREIHSGH